MEKQFWAEAVNSAAHVLNQIYLGSVKGKAPYETWYGKPVDNINKLKTSGPRVSVHVPKATRLKWDPKNKVSIIVGYSDNLKGYRIFFYETNKVEYHRDVVFLSDGIQQSEVQKQVEIMNEHISMDLTESDSKANSEVITYDDEEVSTVEDGENSNVLNENYSHRYKLRKNIAKPSKSDDYEVHKFIDNLR